jgi:hypothetical protein
MKNPEVRNIQWHFGDYLTILPPQGPNQTGVPGDAGKYFLSPSDQYTAINGPIDFGLSYNSKTTLPPVVTGEKLPKPRWQMERDPTSNYTNKSGDPILIGNAFILDFLIPLAKTCFASNRTPPAITFSVYPKVANANLSLDVGNYGGTGDTRRITIDKNTVVRNTFATKYYTDSVSGGNDLFAHPAVPPPFGNLPSSPKTPMW